MMLEFKNVSFRYAVDEFPMMENLSFSVEEGDFVSIIGASGCGKSTIFRLINGLEQLQKGEILVNGRPIREQKQYSAFMPQKDLLFPWRTIEKNICLPMELPGRCACGGTGKAVQGGFGTGRTFGIYEKIPEGFIGRHEAEGFLCAHAAFGGGYAPAG